MNWQISERPTDSEILKRKRQRKVIDRDFVNALRDTNVTGKCLYLSDETSNGNGTVTGAWKSVLYPEGYAFRQQRVFGGFKIWVVPDELICMRCETRLDMLEFVASGQERLRRRDDCPKGCGGRMRSVHKDDDEEAI